MFLKTILKKQSMRTIFKNNSLIFLEQKYVQNLKWSEQVFYVFKYFLKIIFIYNALFLIILHICTINC